MPLKDKNILLGITGGIAAYKIPWLIRLLTAEGANVQPVVTPSALEFVTKGTLSALSGNRVMGDWFEAESGLWNNHVKAGIEADLLLIAPATANTLASMAQGRCDNLLLGIYLSARCPVMIAPAMDHDMWHHPATKGNIRLLQDRGHLVLPPEHGALASGITGDGRLPEPEHLAGAIRNFFSKAGSLAGKKVLITSGPTYEPIDTVRFIGNHSSGRMGSALAEEAAGRGAEVVVISGPARIKPNGKNIRVVDVTTTAQMLEACSREFPECDMGIFAAAVSDFTPEHKTEGKIKKSGEEGLSLQLTQTPDILARMADQRKNGQIIVGFALETENEEASALEKMKRKKLDFIVLNSLNAPGAGFGETNNVVVYSKSNKWESGLLTKAEAATGIINFILQNQQP